MNSEKLHVVLKGFYGIEGEIPPTFLLNQGNGANSIGRARLNALLRKEGIDNIKLRNVKTWAELTNQTSSKY